MDQFVKLHPETEAKIDALLVLMRRVEHRQIAIANREFPLMRDISDIIRAVTLETGLAAAAALALTASQQHLADAQVQIQQLQAQVDSNTIDPAQVQSLLDNVATAAAQLSAAIPANTTGSRPSVVDQPVTAGAVAGAEAATTPVQVLAGTGDLAPVATNAPGTSVTPPDTANSLADAPAIPVATTATGLTPAVPVVAPADTTATS